MPELGLNETPGADPPPDAIAALCRAHPGATGMALISSDTAAFQARRVLARTARHSLDLMYYIWEEDLTGRLLFGEVLAAADRGVKVRLLLDDIGFTSLDRLLQALDSHPNISVRLFNPTRAPKGSLRRGVELGLRLFSMTRRMHNKAWIADGETAILGGRNIGDAYFGASRASNFHDLDLAVLGPVVAEAAVMFQEYWTSEPTHPVRPPLNPIRRRKILNGLRSFGVSAEAKTYLDRLPTLAWPPDEAGLRWCREAHLVADPPEKALGRKGQNWLMASLLPRLEAARERIAIISPYFVPGQNGTRRLCDLAEKGIHISILTNSLSATDVAAVHGAYARYRKPLLRAGIRLFELRAIARLRRLSLRGRTNASLHTKAFIIDGQTGFVGSLNFDPRSASLNTEMGVLFTEPGLVAGIQHIFTAETAPGISHALELDVSGRILWHGTSGSPHRRDPGVSPARRALSWFMGRLPLESQL